MKKKILWKVKAQCQGHASKPCDKLHRVWSILLEQFSENIGRVGVSKSGSFEALVELLEVKNLFSKTEKDFYEIRTPLI